MINIENEIITAVTKDIHDYDSKIKVASEYIPSPSEFPHISIVEQDNSTYDSTLTSGNGENHVSVMYEVDVYSNLTRGKKTECKKLMAIIDNTMINMGFSRIMLQPIPNMDNNTIYRMKARYRGVVSKDKTIYRR